MPGGLVSHRGRCWAFLVIYKALRVPEERPRTDCLWPTDLIIEQCASRSDIRMATDDKPDVKEKAAPHCRLTQQPLLSNNMEDADVLPRGKVFNYVVVSLL